MNNQYDIAIVGGGLVGASLACALADTDIRVVLIEAVPRKSQYQPSYDERVLAIAPGSRMILDAIGIWAGITPEAIVPIKTIHISDRGRFGFARLKHSNHGIEAMGYAVPARELGAATDEQLQKPGCFTLMCPAEVIGLSQKKERVEIKLSAQSDQGEVSAALVVFADGAGSTTRHSLNFESTTYKYDQSVILTTVLPDGGHNYTAYERFTDTGPLALLPSASNRYTVVWTVLVGQVDQLLQCPDDEFLQKLQLRFGDRVGQFRQPGKRKTYPLSLVKVKHPVKHRVVVVGNAAHTIHPVAGQGFNLGLRDVSALAEVLGEAHAQKQDIGDIDVLGRYWQWRRRDVSRVGQFTDGLIRLFSNDYLLPSMVRDAALLTVDVVPPVQRFLVRRTMGLAGRMPRLSRGLSLS